MFLSSLSALGVELEKLSKERLRENLTQVTRDKTGLGQKDTDRDRFLEDRR